MLNKDVDWVKYTFMPGSRQLAIKCGYVTFCKVGSGACTQCAHFLRRDDDNQLVLCTKARFARRPVRAPEKDDRDSGSNDRVPSVPPAYTDT